MISFVQKMRGGLFCPDHLRARGAAPLFLLLGALILTAGCMGGPSQTLLEVNQTKLAVSDLRNSQDESFRRIEHALGQIQREQETQKNALDALREDFEKQLALLRREARAPVSAQPVAAPPPAATPDAAPSPPSVSEDEVFHQAQDQYALGNYDQAIRLYETFIAEHGRSSNAPEAALRLGRSYFQLKQFREAQAAFARVQQDYPDSPRVPLALHSKGLCEIQLGDYAQARTTFETLRREHPDYEPDLVARILETHVRPE